MVSAILRTRARCQLWGMFKADDMTGPIVCGVDDSTGARGAVAAALALSARAELPLLFVHVAPEVPRLPRRDPKRKHKLGEAVSRGIELLERATARPARGRNAFTRVALGDPAEQLAAVAASTGAEMVVIGSRGRGTIQASLLGSVSRRLMMLCERPVLVVPTGARIDPAPRHQAGRRPPSVLCGIDGSPASRQAAAVASRLVASLDDRLVLAHAYPPQTGSLAGRSEFGPVLSQWREAPRLPDVAGEPLRRLPGPELTLEPGAPSEALIRIAQREDAELLVLGSHNHGAGARRTLTGALLASSAVSVLIVPSPDELTAADGGQDQLRERALAAA